MDETPKIIDKDGLLAELVELAREYIDGMATGEETANKLVDSLAHHGAISD